MAEVQPELLLGFKGHRGAPADLDGGIAPLGETPLPRATLAKLTRRVHPGKRLLDMALAAVLLVLFMPVLLLAALLIKLTSRGPIFYTQVRVGKDGEQFTICKLRTMRQDAENSTGPVWCQPADQRITRVGAWLRATHVDEFPQLINVLFGQMSLIGPRPERPEIVERIKLKVEGYTERLQVPPGISGLAQVQLPPDIDLEGVRRKLVCDLYYIKHQSSWLDLRILACTGFLLIGIPLRLSCRLLRIPQPLR